MKKVLKWVGIVLGGLVRLIVVAAIALYASGSARLNKTYDIPVEAIAISSDSDRRTVAGTKHAARPEHRRPRRARRLDGRSRRRLALWRNTLWSNAQPGTHALEPDDQTDGRRGRGPVVVPANAAVE